MKVPFFDWLVVAHLPVQKTSRVGKLYSID